MAAGEYGKMIKREPRDGSVGVQRSNDDILITAEDNDENKIITVSEWNARRLFAMLALVLGFPLPTKTSKQIEM